MATCIAQDLVDRAQRVMEALKERELTVVTAESCTAELIAATLAQSEGASDVLHGSFVAYTKAQKTKALGVGAELLKREGSVTEEVAREMACGALERSDAQLAVSVTGVLGPAPDEDGNPIGLVYFACCIKGGDAQIIKKEYGDRPVDALRNTVVCEALDLLEKAAKKALT